MSEIRPLKFRDDTPERLAARMVAMDGLGAWNPVADDKLVRLLHIDEVLRGVVGYAPLADTIFDAVIAVMAHKHLSPGQTRTMIEPLLEIWWQALNELDPPPPAARAPGEPAACKMLVEELVPDGPTGRMAFLRNGRSHG